MVCMYVTYKLLLLEFGDVDMSMYRGHARSIALLLVAALADYCCVLPMFSFLIIDSGL